MAKERSWEEINEALSIGGLHFAYGSRQVLSDVSLKVSSGHFCALLGPNGAGKSTLFALLSGLLISSNGQILVGGVDLRRNRRRALALMGIVFQETTLDLDLSVRRNLSYFAALHGLSGRTAAIAIDRSMERLEIADRAKDRARDLNGGHRRRAEIARALIHDPKILLLDEPTVGLDVASRAAVTAHVHDLCSDGAVSVLWSTHLVDEVRSEDDLVILNKGAVLAQGTASSIAEDRPLADVFLDLTAETI
jgi:ABC-2 type transport system ATP-binding protein